MFSPKGKEWETTSKVVGEQQRRLSSSSSPLFSGAHGEGEPSADPVCRHHRQISPEDWSGGEPRQDGAQTGQFFIPSAQIVKGVTHQ
jgi:hypothetical protein